MSKKQYTTEQIDILSNNIYIKSITDKYITFTVQMKIEALKLDSQWIYFKDIFNYLWFPNFIIDSSIPKQTMGNWKHKVKLKWFVWLVNTKKWRKIKDKIDLDNLTKDEEINYLRAKVAYLEEIAKIKMQWFP
jgi:hypothetical protein